MFKIKIVGEVKVHANIVRNDWQWRRSTPESTWFIAVRKDVEAGSFDVVKTVVNRFNPRPDFRKGGVKDRVYNTYTEALAAAQKLTAQLEQEAATGV